MTLSSPTFLVDTTFSAKNISTAASVYQFTAAASGHVIILPRLDGVAGGGDYVAYITRQWVGVAGTVPNLPKTTITAAVGETAFEFGSIVIEVKTGDVINLMVDGLAGDTNVSGSIRISADNWSVLAPSDVTVSLAVTQAQAAAAATGSLAITLFDTFRPTAITSTTTDNLSTATKLWCAIKLEADDDDTDALIFIEATAGLTRVAKAAYLTTTHGSITLGGVSGAWTFTLYLSSTVTALLESYVGAAKAYIKYELATGYETQIWSGDASIDYGGIQALGAVA